MRSNLLSIGVTFYTMRRTGVARASLIHGTTHAHHTCARALGRRSGATRLSLNVRQIRSRSPNFGRVRVDSGAECAGQFGRPRAKSGRHRPIWPGIGQVLAQTSTDISGRTRPISAKFGPGSRPKLVSEYSAKRGQNRPGTDKIGSNSAEFDLASTKVDPNSARFRKKWPGIEKHWPRLGQNWPDFGLKSVDAVALSVQHTS